MLYEIFQKKQKAQRRQEIENLVLKVFTESPDSFEEAITALKVYISLEVKRAYKAGMYQANITDRTFKLPRLEGRTPIVDITSFTVDQHPETGDRILLPSLYSQDNGYD